MIPIGILTGAMQAIFGATWNPLDKGPNVVLSNNDRTVSGTMGTEIVRAQPAATQTGKYYFEIVPTVLLGGGQNVGISESADSLTLPVGATSESVGFDAQGQVLSNSTIVDTYFGFKVSDTVQVAYDDATGSVWFGVNGSWVGNPGNGTGATITGVTGTMFPAATVNSDQVFTANFVDADRIHRIPDGFSMYDGSAVGSGATEVVLDSITKPANLALSNGFLTATMTGTNATRVATVTESPARITPSRWYCEFTIGVLNTSEDTYIGMQSPSLSKNINLGSTSSSVGYSASGAIFRPPNSLLTGQPTFTTGDVISLAFDGTSNNRVYFAKNGVWLGGDNPGVVLGGRSNMHDLTALPAASLQDGNSVTFNGGATPFVYSIPPTYGPYDNT